MNLKDIIFVLPEMEKARHFILKNVPIFDF